MRVLINCERSGKVREAFRARGHDAWSCDLRPSDDGSAFHIVDDAIAVSRRAGWDLMIAHPPCQYLSVSGQHWNHRRPGRLEHVEAAIEFATALWHAPIKLIALENPIGILSTRGLGKPDQIIQPFHYGHNASKRTCLWLKGLPRLVPNPSHAISPRLVWDNDRGDYVYRWANQTDSGQNRLGPKRDPITGEDLRSKARAETYEGIARAMAEQWGE